MTGDGADLLVDAVCFTEGDARLLLPHLTDVTSTVMLSSKAVYVDAAGNHVNSDVAPRFDAPITKATRHESRRGRLRLPRGLRSEQVAAENALLDSGHPVTVIRRPRFMGTGRPGNGCS